MNIKNLFKPLIIFIQVHFNVILCMITSERFKIIITNSNNCAISLKYIFIIIKNIENIIQVLFEYINAIKLIISTGEKNKKTFKSKVRKRKKYYNT